MQKQPTRSFSRKNKKILPIMLFMLGAVIVIAAGAGSVKVPFIQTMKIIVKNIGAAVIAVIEPVMAKVPFLKNAGTSLKNSGFLFQNAVFTEGHEQIIYLIRLPRVLMAVVTGAALSTSGAVMQCLFRNPMADPGILGVSSGAGLGAVIAIGMGLTAYSIYFLPLFASAGSLAAAFLIFVLSARKGKVPVMNLILSGIAVSMFLSAITTVLLSFISGDQVKQYILDGGHQTLEQVRSLGLWFCRLSCTTVLLLLAKELM